MFAVQIIIRMLSTLSENESTLFVINRAIQNSRSSNSVKYYHGVVEGMERDVEGVGRGERDGKGRGG